MGLSVPCRATASNMSSLGPVLYILRHMAVAGWDNKMKSNDLVPRFDQFGRQKVTNLAFDPMAVAVDWLDAYRAGDLEAILESLCR